MLNNIKMVVRGGSWQKLKKIKLYNNIVVTLNFTLLMNYNSFVLSIGYKT